MKKLLVLAALAGGMYSAAPIGVASADPMPAKCLFFPLLQADCRAAISDAIAGHRESMKADVDKSALWDGLTRIPSPLYWLRCEHNEEGGTLLVCD